MKKLFYITMSLLLAAGFVACNDDIVVGEVDLGYLELVESNVNFDYLGGTGTIVVDTESAVTAEIDASASWATASVSGNVVTVTVPEHSALESRNTSVTVSADNRSIVVPISQTSLALLLGTDAVSFSKQAGSQTIAFTPGNTPVVITVADADKSWLSTQVDGGNIVVSVEGNPGNERTSTVSVTYRSQAVDFTVRQASSLSTSQTSLSFAAPAESKSFTFDVTEGIDVTATSSEEWATPTVDMEKKTVTVAVAAYTKLTTRNAVITLKTISDVTVNIAVSQVGISVMDAVVGNWHVRYDSYFDNAYIEAPAVVITKTGDSTVNIAGLLEVIPAANFDATVNSDNLTLVVPDLTPFNGVTSNGNAITIGTMTGNNLVITIKDGDTLVMETAPAQSQSDFWGLYIPANGSWVRIYEHTLWTKQ